MGDHQHNYNYSDSDNGKNQRLNDQERRIQHLEEVYHYVYKIEHIETGEFYYGSRTSECHPTLDDYMGSMKRWKPDKTKLKKVIIKDDFKTRKEAIEYESELIKENIKHEFNRNYSLPNGKLGFYGMKHSEETKKNKG